MKKLFLLISLMILGFMAVAQTSPLKMVNFHKLPNEIADLKALKDEAGRDCDSDSNKAALIIVKTQGFSQKVLLDFNYYTRGIEMIHHKIENGELLWYVGSNSKGSIVIKYMGEYEFKIPHKLEAKAVYELVLGMETATLVIRAIPSEAEIYIDNDKVGTGEAISTVSIGVEHRYRIVCKDYYTKEGVVFFSQREEKSVNVELEPNFGYITIKSEPSGVDVYIDETIVGVTPYQMKRIKLGSHVVELRKTGYETYADMVTVKSNEVNKQLENVKLVRDGNFAALPVAVSPTTPANTASSVTSTTSSGNITFTVNGVSFEMVYVKGGNYTMGGTSEQGGKAKSNEKPTHYVTLSDYYVGKYEVTQELWQALMGNNPSYFKGKHLPVEQVRWNDVQEFITKLNQYTGLNFRLLTEAEWEYAARGGNKTKKSIYSGNNNLNNIAWYRDNSEGKTHDVGTKSPNELGIYDMSGNVMELCQDWYGDYYYGNQINPTGAYSGTKRVIRGGSWNDKEKMCRVSCRTTSKNDGENTLGFRLAITHYSSYFSVSPNKKVEFSKGNLQYLASTRSWRFAEHQWDAIGKHSWSHTEKYHTVEALNRAYEHPYSGWIDRFIWGTGNQPTAVNRPNYFVEWGENIVSEDDDKHWRTLTSKEWEYLFKQRCTSSGIRYVKAIVNDISGIILLPDNWSISNYSLKNTDKSDASFRSNRISKSDWLSIFEPNGAVFLPACLYNADDPFTEDYIWLGGLYWSCSSKSSEYAYCILFDDKKLKVDEAWFLNKAYFSVRLVSDVEN